MKILVIGGSSFIGKSLIEKAKISNYECYYTTRMKSSKDQYSIYLELSDLQNFKIQPTNKFNSIIYLSWSFEKKFNNPEAYEKLLDILLPHSNQHIFISSYSAHKHALSHYGTQKNRVEKIFLHKNQSVIRPGLVIGRSGLFNKLKKIVSLLPILPVFSDKNSIPLISLDHLTDEVFNCMDTNPSVKNLFIQKKICFPQLIQTISKVLNKKIIIIKIPDFFFLTIAKLFKFGPTYGISENIYGIISNAKAPHTSSLPKYSQEPSKYLADSLNKES